MTPRDPEALREENPLGRDPEPTKKELERELWPLLKAEIHEGQ